MRDTSFIAEFAGARYGALMRRITGALCVSALAATVAAFLNPAAVAISLVLNTAACLAAMLLCWASQLHATREAQALARQRLAVQEDERQRLSRDLHDDIGQLLTAAKLQLAWLSRRIDKGLEGPASELGATLDESLGKIRNLSTLLHPRQLDELGLEASVRAYLIKALALSPLKWTFDCNQRLEGISAPLSIAVFRILQEAVTNCLRHAQASNLGIALQRRPEGLYLVIADDGQGFDPLDCPPQGCGLAGMQERASLLNAHWVLDTAPARGTRIAVTFPWPARTAERADLRT